MKELFSTSKVDNEKNTRFQSLDGFRGTLVLSVVLEHLTVFRQVVEKDNIFTSLGTYYGVSSFFVLSAFLLTYKVFSLMNETNGSLKEIGKITINYIIRRFFRIYVPYFFFITVLILTKQSNSLVYVSYASWIELVFLQKPRKNHLWTILPECKYYFIIPIFTFITFKMKKYFIPWICFIIMSIFLFQNYNLFGLKCKRLFDPERESLFHTFQIFLNGSLIGVIYYKIEKCSYNFKTIKR